ncbi:FecCD family ABC transporter permease, partial [Geobacillus thermoleovorans]|nr:iron ABC transporter permease [Geobacillus thermoleovorans]
MKKYITVRMGKHISFFYDKKAVAVLAALIAAAVLLFLISIGSGEMRMSPLEAAAALFGYGEEIHQTVIVTFRLPRVLVAWLAGMALAAAGAILQGMVRNPLASPDVLGITGGAAAAVVGFLALFSDENNSLTVSIHWLPLAAFLGAAAAAWLVYMLAWKNGLAPLRLVLVGIGVSALMQALTTLLMITGPIYRASQANVWITGSVYGASWQHVSLMAPWVIGLLLVAILAARHVNVQELGDELAIGLGGAVERQRLGLVLLSTA